MTAYLAWYTIPNFATVDAAKMDDIVARAGVRFPSQRIAPADAFRTACRDDVVYDLGENQVRLHLEKPPGFAEATSPSVVRRLIRTESRATLGGRPAVLQQNVLATLVMPKKPTSGFEDADITWSVRVDLPIEEWTKARRFVLGGIRTRQRELLTTRPAEAMRRLSLTYLREAGGHLTAKNGAWILLGPRAAEHARRFHDMVRDLHPDNRVFVARVDEADDLSKELLDGYADGDAEHP